MTLVAAVAGVLAAVGIVDLASAPRAQRARGRGRRALLTLGRRIGVPAAPRDLADRIEAAGVALTPPDAMAIKAGAAAAGALTALVLAVGAPGRLGLVLPPTGAAAGFIGLDVWLHRRRRVRAERIAVELPDVVDLLRVALEAGLPPTRALAEVGKRHAGVLAAELRTAAARCAVGVSRRDALRGLERRAPTEGVRAVTAVLDRADRLGAPPAEALQALARDARESRARTRAEAAAKAAPKIQLIIALLLVPSVMLLIAAALAPALLGAV